ncbi:MAG: hypothetical protein IJX62_06015, partial [Clostridia bacterium]|nr:hypothetical protein [Clostridia bacterium]
MMKQFKTKRLAWRALSVLLTLCMILPLLPVIAFAEGERTVIYFDLAAGSITISATAYSGYVYKWDAEQGKYVAEAVSATGVNHTKYHYYVYQSSFEDGKNPVPERDDDDIKTVKLDANGDVIYPSEYDIADDFLIGNNTGGNNSKAVAEEWENRADETGTDTTAKRTAVDNNKITVKTNVNCLITVHNIWLSYEATGNSRGTAGIEVITDYSNKQTFTQAEFRLKGDNRVHNIYYASSDDRNKLTFTSAQGNGSADGTLTVITKYFGTDITPSTSTGISNNGLTGGYWTSAIGGNDSAQDSKGIYIHGGTIYAGTPETQNATAIGGGGNGTGNIEITGGIVTAVASTTGTAIGGGIGYSSTGGIANITISGGQVYAYNFGRVHPNNSKTFVPGTAIGGGSSYSADAYESTISISAGTVYAESLGGVAIGGGNSVDSNAGDSTVNISENANVTAISRAGTDSMGQNVGAGTAIGAGNSTKKAGGDATINISGGTTVVQQKLADGTLVGGPIGGGSSQGTTASTGYGGKGTVEITGGTITAGVIGGGSAVTGVGGNAEVTIRGGTLNAGGIGGGESEKAAGGTATVTIEGGNIVAGTVGGGHSVQGVGGDATVTVSGGTIRADGVGGGFSDTLGYSNGTVTIT